MASSSGRRFVQNSTSAVRSFLNCTRRAAQSPQSVSTGSSNLGGISSTNSAARRQSLFSFSRVPVELGGAVSLMPLHSATASALLNSMLSSKVGQWGCLSEAFATPL